MHISMDKDKQALAKSLRVLSAIATLVLALLPGSAQAIPAFNRQTGQN